MTRIAIWDSESLVGKEIKNSLAGRRELWDDLRLLGPESDSALVSDIGDAAALVLPATEDYLNDVDLLFYCARAGEPVEVPAGLPETATTIVVAGDEPVEGLPAVVAGINSDGLAGIERPSTLLSAHPAAVALAHLLGPLVEFGLESCAAFVVLPSSSRGQEGIDALLAETRAILAFQPRPEETILGHQLAFNIAPSTTPGAHIAAAVDEALAGDRPRVAVQTSVGSVFHSLLVGAHVQLAASADEAAVREALEASPAIEVAESPETLGPIDAAGSSSLHLGAIEASAAPGSFWLRAAMDNLTMGGALNAIGIAEAVLGVGSGGGDGYTM